MRRVFLGLVSLFDTEGCFRAEGITGRGESKKELQPKK